MSPDETFSKVLRLLDLASDCFEYQVWHKKNSNLKTSDQVCVLDVALAENTKLTGSPRYSTCIYTLALKVLALWK